MSTVYKPTHSTPFTDGRCCFFGDSFVAGVGDREAMGWVGRVVRPPIQAGVPLTVYNLGVRRDTALDVAKRWPKESEPRFKGGDWYGTLFSFGVNDTSIENGQRHLSADDSCDKVEWLVKKAKNIGHVLFIGPPPATDMAHNIRIKQLSIRFQRHLAPLGVAYLDIFSELINDEIWMESVRSGDGSHPGASGYERFAAQVLDWDDWWFSPPQKTE